MSSDSDEDSPPTLCARHDMDLGLDLGNDSPPNHGKVQSTNLSKMNNLVLPSLTAKTNDTSSSVTPRLNAKETKIIELSKKLRNMNMALEREKNTNIDLSNKLKTLQALSSRTNPTAESVSSADSKQRTELKALKEKLTYTLRKLEEERITTQGLKTELRNTQKALAMEVGDEDANVSKILEGLGTGWKGRSQQIQILKERMRELSLRSSSVAVAAEGTTHKQEIENSHHESIRRISERRQETFDQLAADFNKLTADHADMKRKYEAVQARNKILEKEIKGCKSKIHILVEKATNDDTLIQAMHAELEGRKAARTKQKAKENEKLTTVYSK
ncbi:hypothetical protein BCR33DRAFT_718755 [Rhizoclosmatium globosum]|uniref:Coiled-coil domain-containing protein 13 n=1 Tax=Rhizoclosmatium globosum TaxID=329046 RepID=A0A1Y2C3R7_9FUNG|nr:hypothetical protein BCR33DRAFT_718755 [Rhizoclosmatium globosum]|eukprot:ORY41596.1 hypothetical protein BCR33DRAFT_718755 [Rhizoclosmatium globosum]